MYGHPDAVFDQSKAVYSIKTSLSNTKLEGFVNLGELFLIRWITSCFSRNLFTDS